MQSCNVKEIMSGSLSVLFTMESSIVGLVSFIDTYRSTKIHSLNLPLQIQVVYFRLKTAIILIITTRGSM